MEPARLDSARKAALKLLVSRLGFASAPASLLLLHQALVHRSWAVENNAPDNERLEFLGDAVINLITAEYLFETQPEAAEGDLSKMRASMVSRKMLGRMAEELRIGELLLLGVGEEGSGGRNRSTTLGSALEAVYGALYQSYPWEEVRESLRTCVVLPILRMGTEQTTIDFKSALQEWTQRNLQDIPSYRVTSSTGPDHNKMFVVEVRFAGELAATGKGGRKKHAENDAARIALERIEQGWRPLAMAGSEEKIEERR